MLFRFRFVLPKPITAFFRSALFFLAVALSGCMGQEQRRDTDSEEVSGIVTIQQTPDGYLFMEGADSVLVYRDRPPDPEREHARVHYVHPLYSLNGSVLTEDFPKDHLHQHGVFWAWHQVFVHDRRLGDGWIQEDISWDVYEVKTLESGESAGIRTQVHWLSPRYADDEGNAVPFVRETMVLRVYRAAGIGAVRYREIDVAITLRALVEGVRIGGSEDEKGYGGFSARIRLPSDVRFTGSNGAVTPMVTAVEAGSWVDVSATFDGQELSGLAILQYPANPGYPQVWILRREESMQNPQWPGEEPIALPMDEEVILRYRLVLHEGDAEALSLEGLQGRYADSGGSL